jgi:hypothetical protein
MPKNIATSMYSLYRWMRQTLVMDLFCPQAPGSALAWPLIVSATAPTSYIFAMCDPSSGLITEPKKTKTEEGKEETTHGHIMITEPGTVEAVGSELKVKVVESTGGRGLVDSEYRILKVTKAKDRAKEGVFRVFRGSKGEEMSVKIARLG